MWNDAKMSLLAKDRVSCYETLGRSASGGLLGPGKALRLGLDGCHNPPALRHLERKLFQDLKSEIIEIKSHKEEKHSETPTTRVRVLREGPAEGRRVGLAQSNGTEWCLLSYCTA